jgi:UDP-2,3-diacylglucosamine pyrophosphatase LpxH
LGYWWSNENLFREFLDDIVDTEEVTHLVLAGDILDMWRRDNMKLFFDFGDILSKLEDLQNRGKHIYYVVGNHDYHMMQLEHNIEQQYTFDISMGITLTYGDQDYYFIHGYQFEFSDMPDTYEDFANILCLSDDTIGRNADKLWNLYKAVSPLWEGLEEKAREYLGKTLDLPFERLSDEDIIKLQETIEEWRTEDKNQIDDKFIVYGHTHRPYVDTAKKEANTGSWVDDPQHPPPENNTYKKNTYITIEEDGTVTLEEYTG